MFAPEPIRWDHILNENLEMTCDCSLSGESEQPPYKDPSSHVFNGDKVKGQKRSGVHTNYLSGGSVKNNSRFINGDLDKDTFLAFFCRD